MSVVEEVHEALSLPDYSLVHTDEPDLGWKSRDAQWKDYQKRGYFADHAIAATRSWLYVPKKYRVHRKRFSERIGNPLFYFWRVDHKMGPRHGAWYLNRFNRQIIYGEEEFEGNIIRPDPMLGFATRHPALWGEEHLRIKHAERSIERKRHFNDYLNKLTVHCFDTCIVRDTVNNENGTGGFNLENYEMNDVEGRCIRQCFKRTMEAKGITISQTQPGTTSFLG